MGRIGNREKCEKIYTEKSILERLNISYLAQNSIKYLMNNLFVFGWESDYLAITKNGLFHEIEIKISRADFKKDFEKEDKHLILEDKYVLSEHDLKFNNNILKPNYFYYAVPENLINEDEIPHYAGLIYIVDYYPFIKIVKKAPQLTKNKIKIEDLNLTDKFYYNMWQWKNNAEKNYPQLINELKEQVKLSKIDENGNKYKYNLKEANDLVHSMECELKRYKTASKYDYEEINAQRYNIRRMKRLLEENHIEYEYDYNPYETKELKNKIKNE